MKILRCCLSSIKDGTWFVLVVVFCHIPFRTSLVYSDRLCSSSYILLPSPFSPLSLRPPSPCWTSDTSLACLCIALYSSKQRALKSYQCLCGTLNDLGSPIAGVESEDSDWAEQGWDMPQMLVAIISSRLGVGGILRLQVG